MTMTTFHETLAELTKKWDANLLTRLDFVTGLEPFVTESNFAEIARAIPPTILPTFERYFQARRRALKDEVEFLYPQPGTAAPLLWVGPGLQIRLGVVVQIVEIGQPDEHGVEVKIHALGYDRDTGYPRPLVFAAAIGPALSTGANQATLVRYALLKFMAHEVDEAILLDGERPFDPHRRR